MYRKEITQPEYNLNVPQIHHTRAHAKTMESHIQRSFGFAAVKVCVCGGGEGGAGTDQNNFSKSILGQHCGDRTKFYDCWRLSATRKL